MSNCEVHTLTPVFELEQHQVREVLRILLHTILFNRALGPVKPVERDSELFEVTWVECGDAEAARRIEEKVTQFVSWAQRNPGTRGQVCLSFYEKRQRQSWFSTSEERLYWEQWVVEVAVVEPPPAEFEEQQAFAASALRSQRRQRVQAAIEEGLTGIVRQVNDKRDHIPPVVSASAVTFPFDLQVAGGVLTKTGAAPGAAAISSLQPLSRDGRHDARRQPMMRQLADLLNSFAGSAARLQSSLPTPPTAGMPPGAAGGVVPPPPLSPHAAAAHPALAAAEAALMAKLAGGALGCNAEYAVLLRLNDRLGLQGRFVAAATHPELNRYCDVLPFDSNRVRLGQQPGSQPAVTHESSGVPAGPSASRAGSGSAGATAGAAAGTAAAASDYINASPLQRRSEEDIEWRYIAAQGPLRDTREAFWQMVVEGGASAVVMLTNLVERGVHKCSRYFPEAPRTSKYLGRYLVSTRSLEQLSPVLIRRSVSVKDAGPLLAARRHAQQAQQAQPAAAPSFTVQHFHYSAWPDHGVPTSPEPLLALCAELRRRGAHASPIVVHCSAGIGRSGVFCVLDVITRRLLGLQGCQDAARGAAAVDVAALVADLRHQRLGMVQTREQYQFCHMALLHFIRRLLEQPAPAAPAGGGKAASHTALVIPVRTS